MAQLKINVEKDREIKDTGNNSGGKKTIIIVIAVLVIVTAAIVVGYKFITGDALNGQVRMLSEAEIPDWIDKQILPSNCNSRRNVELEDITAIAVHYVGNPGSTAQNNHDYYGNSDTEVNSHFIVGLNGEIIQCLPLDERSSATNERNKDTISIEVCHPDETGKFTDATYSSLVKLTAWLCDLCGFDESGIIRHYDVTGKMCPLYFVEHEDAWITFKQDVMTAKNSKSFLS